MTIHKDIQNPDDYTEADYQKFERKLFSPFSSVDELEDICMTLAHLPTKRAQDLLGKFQESGRANEVGWLDIAAEEGMFHYLSPENKQEEREYLTLKVIQELEDEIIELEVEHDKLRLEWDWKDIEQEAIIELIKAGEVEPSYENALQGQQLSRKSRMQDLRQDISVKEKILVQLKKMIKSEKYQQVKSETMRHVHFC